MTHVRVVVDTFQPGAADEALARVYEELAPQLQRQPGFRSYQVVRTGKDTAIFINAWESPAQADAASALVIAWAQANLAGLIASVERHAGELVFSV